MLPGALSKSFSNMHCRIASHRFLLVFLLTRPPTARDQGIINGFHLFQYSSISAVVVFRFTSIYASHKRPKTMPARGNRKRCCQVPWNKIQRGRTKLVIQWETNFQGTLPHRDVLAHDNIGKLFSKGV
ncbi:hypothetical protein TraAM80_02364 [Trypanosoma rangeli]|uniref:Uncharacterized protein n=1 Tax=Trypanosoma rangeli TaxID=5698 RepID=A0A3R7KJV7_TRYRA|nr:uncharacterized protein TraAM80_02364 [Trypanosoma rangeli]RNF08957.1 hypothetical protein TraAM80_02364 [Trypanosoma rangeli]|eukprot:RNF08957.1 hypothetical protein TraAM80_02364 [Trypanosoma rangeli]